MNLRAIFALVAAAIHEVLADLCCGPGGGRPVSSPLSFGFLVICQVPVTVPAAFASSAFAVGIVITGLTPL